MSQMVSGPEPTSHRRGQASSEEHRPSRKQAGRRTREPARRARRVEFTLTEKEFSELDAAAAQAGLSRGAYAAQVVLAGVRGEGCQTGAPAREALAELIRCAGLVRRAGVNLNQAVAKLNATGQRSADLLPWAAESVRRARRLDAVAEELRRKLR
ncbi:MAG TPA: hypothetical protein VGS19_37290 [Streptosporangiaceae bacterium]|nr:hypothetical protein [Streptosporangiaceae bacterium]